MIYLLGSIATLQSVFPNHDWEHSRKSLDGTQAILEAELTVDEAEILSNSGIQILSHQEALDYLNNAASEGIWYESFDSAQDGNV